MTKQQKEERRAAARARREGAMQPGPAAKRRTARSFRRWARLQASQPAVPRRTSNPPVRVPRFAHADWLERRIERDRRRNGVPA